MNTTVMKFKKITVDPDQMGGAPCIRHLRIPVATIIKLLAEGSTFEGVLELYPDLEEADLREALGFAAHSVEQREIALAS